MPEKERNDILNEEQVDIEAQDGAADYVEAIKKLKANSVSKEDYDKLQAEKNELLKALVDGGQVDLPENEQELPSLEELKKQFSSEDSSNLQVVEAALKIREKVMSEGGEDPFLPSGEKAIITQHDREAAENVAKIFQECVDYAQGDSQIFTMELQRRTIDVAPQRSAKRK